MKSIETIKLKQDATIKEALKIIDNGSMQIALVVDDENRLLGTLTDGDVRRGILKGLDLNSSIETIIFKMPTIAKIGATKEEILKLQEELKQKEKIQKEYEEKVKEDAKRAIQEAIEIERIKLSKRPIIDLSKEIEKNEDVIKEETIKEENAADEYDEISELTGDMRNDSIDAYIVNDGPKDEKNIVEANNDIDNLEEIDEITGKRVLQNKNVEREINRYPENNRNINKR